MYLVFNLTVMWTSTLLVHSEVSAFLVVLFNSWCACVCPLGADCSVSRSRRSARSLLLLLLLLWDFLGFLSGSEGWLLYGSLLNPGERTASHVQTVEGWLMAKWPSRWTSTAPTLHRPSHTTTSTRAASNLRMSTCKSTDTNARHKLVNKNGITWRFFFFYI